MMLVGTTMSDLVAVTTKPSSAEIAAHTSSVTKKEALSKQKVRNVFCFCSVDLLV